MTATPPPQGRPGAPPRRTCPRCGAERVHRSRTRSVLEALRRAVTPYEPVRCHACGHRGWRERSGPRHRERGRPARPLERRDVEAARRHRARMAVMALLAAVIGTAVALWFVVE